MAAAVLHEQGHNARMGARFAQAGAATVATMLERGINCPRTSSMGRVFDAAAGLLGLCTHMQYEAQAAMLVEQAAARHIERHGWPQAMQDGWRISGDAELDLLPVLAALDAAADVDQAAARLHATLVAALGDWVARAAQASGLRTLAWGGGCFLNALLSAGLRQNLESRGIAVLAPQRASPGDSGIALGQAWVAINSLES
jgi:hydrogenase maturation protein HypF